MATTKRLNLKLPAELHTRATLLRVRRGYPSLQAWAADVIADAVEAQEAQLAEEERRRRGR